MKFIILLISLLLQRETRKKDYQRDRSWFVTLTKAFNVDGKPPRKQIAIYVLCAILPALLLTVVFVNMKGFVWGSVAVLLQIALFLYVLGRDDVTTRFKEYRKCWQAKDYQGAYHCAQRDMGIEQDMSPSADGEEKADIGDVKFEQTCVEDPKTLHKKVYETVALAWFTRFFVLIFWFVVGGVPLALSALLTYWFAQEYKFTWVQSLVSAMEWVPSRLLGFTLALAGDFTDKFASALKYGMDFTTTAHEVVVDISSQRDTSDVFNAEEAHEQLKELNQLMYRGAVIWLIVIGAATLFGNLS